MNTVLQAMGLKTYHRLSVLDPGRQSMAEPLGQTPGVVEGRRILEAPRPRYWRFCEPPRLSRDPRAARFSRLTVGSHVATSESTIDALLAACEPTALELNRLVEGGSRDPLVLSEQDVWKKITIQVGTNFAWFVPPISKGLDAQALDPAFEKAARIVVKRFKRASEATGLGPETPDPSGTQSGFPFFTSHPAAKAAGCALWAGDYARTLDKGRSWCSNHGLPDEFAFANGLGGRSGPVYKWTPEWYPTASGWRADTETRGYMQRNRVVQMSPLVINYMLRPFYRTLHDARKTLIGQWRTGREDVRLHLGSKFNYEADVSGFDNGVTIIHQATLASVIAEEWPALAKLADTWFRCEQHALITPSFTLNSAFCAAVVMAGGISSGLKPTSEIGTMIADILSVATLMKMGFDVAQWPEVPGVRISNQGDDVRISSDVALDTAQWTESFQQMGFSCELRPGWVFLAKHLFPDGRMVPVAGRLVQQTISNEHEKIGKHGLGLQYLGFLARFEGSEHHHPFLSSAVWSAIKEVEWIAELRCSSVAAVRTRLLEPDCQRTIAASLVNAAVDKSMEAILKDAAHSPTAAAIVAMARKLGWSDARVLSDDLRLDYAVKSIVHDWSQFDKDDLLARAEAAAFQGPAAWDALYAHILGKI